MSDPTTQAKLIERLRDSQASLDRIERWADAPTSNIYADAADMIESLAAAPGLVPLPKEMPDELVKIICDWCPDAPLRNRVWEYMRRFATLAPLAAQSHDQAIVEIERHNANEWADAATNGLQWLKNVDAWIATPSEAIANMETNIKRIRDEYADAKRSAQSPPRGERIERSGKDRRSVFDENMAWRRYYSLFPMRAWQKPDRRAQPQSGEDESPINPMIEAYDETDCRIGSRSDFKSRARSEWMKVFIEELAKRNLRVVSDGGR